jgi:ABC-type amino acid transport system permease subunit
LSGFFRHGCRPYKAARNPLSAKHPNGSSSVSRLTAVYSSSSAYFFPSLKATGRLLTPSPPWFGALISSLNTSAYTGEFYGALQSILKGAIQKWRTK